MGHREEKRAAVGAGAPREAAFMAIHCFKST
jgi:hypothetical protein